MIETSMVGEKNIFYLTTQLIILCLILNCSGKDNVIVYVAGYEENKNACVAKIWKNGKPENLSDGTKYAWANSIYVSGTDVYVAGNASEGVAQLWINGVGKKLTNGENYAGAKSVFVSGSDILVAGFESGSENNDRAKYWKNGKSITLSKGFEANSIATLGKDVYIVGSDVSFLHPVRFPSAAKMWKNGKDMNLTDERDSAIAESVFVSGNDVYVAGFVLGNNIFGGDRMATYWKNGTAVQLSDETRESEAYSIFVFGDDVYVAGYENDGKKMKAVYWKNGKATYLTNGKHRAKAKSIYVIENSRG